MARNHPPLKLRRGTEAQILAASVSDFEVGEPIFATDSGKLFIKNAAGTLEEISGSGDGSGPGGTVAWGSITGLLSNQTDLNTALSGKASTGHSHNDATTSVAGFMSASDKTKLDGVAAGATDNTGTVTSVDLSVPSSLLSVSGNPVTGSGTLAISLPNRDANAVFAGPTTGAAAAPSFRSLVADDIPNLAATKITSGQIPSAVTFDTADLTGFSNAVASRLLEELPTSGGVLDIAQESTLIGLSNDIDAIEARSITAGAGLTGGGTLAASRTLAVDFATTKTAGRAVEANDPRLDDTRTPTDNTVSTAKIADAAVTEAKLANAAVTMAKIAQAGATTNQVIKWNGTAWAPADDATATAGAGAPSDAEYLVKSSNGGLSAERVVTDSTSITADWATGGQVQLKRAALTGDVTADANSNTTVIADNAVIAKHIADNGVPYDKIQDVSATDKILGRSSAGAGDIEEITCTAAGRALLDDADAAAQRTTLGAAAASHAHGNLTNDGKIGTDSGKPIKTGADGVLEAGAFGTSAGQFAEGNHTHAWTDITSKPSDFTPSAHTHGLTDSYVGEIAAAADQDYTIDLRVPFARVVTEFSIISASGTCTAALKNGSNTIVGSVSVSSTIATKTGGDLDNTHKSLSANDKVVVTISSNSSALRVQFCVKYTAVTGAIS